MVSNKNIFYSTNPARMMDALYQVLQQSAVPLEDMLIFLPSRRAVRMAEKFLVNKAGHSILLPRLVALGEVPEEDTDDENEEETVSDIMRLVTVTKLLTADPCIGNISTALPIAHDLLQMQDYLENEGIDATKINWLSLVDERYAEHFQHKAKLLNVLSQLQVEISDKKPTVTQIKNSGIRAWINKIKNYKLVVVCGSTASVPATSDLMVAVANADNGRIILSGHIYGQKSDLQLPTNPYNAEYKFLSRLNVAPEDVLTIDVGDSAIDFFNFAFSNDTTRPKTDYDLSHCHLINCDRESEEADVVAEIAERAIAKNQSVLVITPDAAGNQRIATAFAARGLNADFSGGISGAMSPAGRAILNKFDELIENNDTELFDKIYFMSEYDLMKTIIKMVDDLETVFTPSFESDDSVSVQLWRPIKKLSECLSALGIRLNIADARSLIADVISSVRIRGILNDSAKIAVLGTIESRMQTADVVILTGLNDGMFPARGYENAWLPQDTAEKIGLPSPDRKVSLQSLDFMNLSCGANVYWTRSDVSGGVKTTPSRFLSRVTVRRGCYDTHIAKDILNTVRNRDAVLPRSLDYSAPVPPVDWNDVYVTELELLIHNPYAFYVRHMLRLRVLNDYWATPDARDFGNLVHDVIENSYDFSQCALVKAMDEKALKKLGTESVLFHFWHKRFIEIAPVVASLMAELTMSVPEINGSVLIDGHNVRARADRVWDGGVLDIKTGAAPTKTQLEQGNMPQLPLEAYMLQNGGFKIKTTEVSKNPVMIFLQLKNNDVRIIKYDAETTKQLITAAVNKVKQMIDIFLVGRAPYEYRETSDAKYKIYDDLARCDD